MNKFKFSKERERDLINSIQEFFITERDDQLGDLAASIVLDFIINEVGAEIYNQGVADSYKYMSDRVEDLLGITK
ncbi:DUF2164 domain-containing protein [uncultured Clostridium sp.]|jgi:uncharacterized protein (DUF2164 family)|uniref:DUF2164 domain-containing protein n=1 Tax=uncultured Clostridium sp. TaxID=59620 RepID=UPI00262E3248|nr:DUF2164 domain-containing protein [uncultured Clostridium sp.]